MLCRSTGGCCYKSLNKNWPSGDCGIIHIFFRFSKSFLCFKCPDSCNINKTVYDSGWTWWNSMSLVQRLNLGKKHILKKCLYVYNSVSLPILCIITLLYQPNMVSYRHSSSLWLAEVCDWFTSLFVLGLWRLATGHRTSPSAVLRHALLENIYKKYIRVRYISKYRRWVWAQLSTLRDLSSPSATQTRYG